MQCLYSNGTNESNLSKTNCNRKLLSILKVKHFVEEKLGYKINVFLFKIFSISKKVDSICPRSSYPSYIVTYYIKWVTTSWIYGSSKMKMYEKIIHLFR